MVVVAVDLPADAVVLRAVGTPVVIGDIVWVIGCGVVGNLSLVVTSHGCCDWCHRLFDYVAAGAPLTGGFGVSCD